MSRFVSIVLFLGLAAAFVAPVFMGCTAAQGVDVARVLAGFCPAGVTLLGAPGMAPLCASIPEVEAVLASWLAEDKARAAAPSPSSSVRFEPPKRTSEDLYRAVAARRAVR